MGAKDTEMRRNLMYATDFMYRALVRRLVEIADTPSATERMVAYDKVARAHQYRKQEEEE